LNWLLVWKLDWGFAGAPIAMACTQLLLPVLLLGYVCFIDGSQCWDGFSWRAFSNWGEQNSMTQRHRPPDDNS
jgi:MATE family multidrug resistance protein